MKSKLWQGFFYTSLAQVVNVVSVLLVNIILSHKLAPSDFGIITIVQVLATFISLFTGEAVPSAIIQKKELVSKDFGVLFNYSVIFGSIATLLFGLSGYLFAIVFRNHIYVRVCWLMSILVLTSFLNCIPQGLFLRRLEFRALSVRRMISSLLGLISGVSSVLLGAGIYAIAIALVVPAVFTLLFSILYVQIDYTWNLTIKPLRVIYHYLIEQTKFSVLNYGYRNIDNVLIGKFLGSTALGFYSKSYQLLSQPITLFLGVVTPVLQPVLSNFEDDPEYIRSFFLKMINSVAFITIPISIFVSLNSKDIVMFLFGSQWSGAVMPMRILALSIWVQLLSQIITPIWQSRNLPKLQTRNGLISFGVIAASIVMGISTKSVVMVAVAVSVSYYLNFLISARMLMKQALQSQISEVFSVLKMPLLSGVINIGSLLLIDSFIQFSSSFLTLLVRGLLWLLEVIGFLGLTGNLQKIISLFGRSQI